VFEGRLHYRPDELPMRRLRTYRLCKLLHCTPSALLDESAVDLDWLLAIEDTESAAAHARRKRGNRRSPQPAGPRTFDGGGFNV
jgi:hypothetical protein